MHGGVELPLWTVAPFAGLLLSIAVLPIVLPHFWESHLRKALVAALFAVPVAVYLVAVHGAFGAHELAERAKEFISFIVLLGSLYVVTGGVYVRGSLAGTPLVNTALIGLGGVLASAIGTTGASVLLVRPLLRANAPREDKAHVLLFFIFVVSNCGGLLTPLGDPPLFLGFLKGVPFEWTFRLFGPWLLVNGTLLLLFAAADHWIFAREERRRPGSQRDAVLAHEPLRVEGAHNLLFLAGIVAAIYAAGRGVGAAGGVWPFGVQEGLMAALAAAAWAWTPARLRAANAFAFGPIVEVAVLFAGIFTTMAPALLLLNAHAQSFGIREPWQFFWATGSEAARVLAAISCGAVFMGANTYIGNGPNFMVKAIAEESGVRMPGFFGYMAWSGAILLPIFALTTLLFF